MTAALEFNRLSPPCRCVSSTFLWGKLSPCKHVRSCSVGMGLEIHTWLQPLLHHNAAGGQSQVVCRHSRHSEALAIHGFNAWQSWAMYGLSQQRLHSTGMPASLAAGCGSPAAAAADLVESNLWPGFNWKVDGK